MGWSQVEKDRNLYERRLTPVRSSELNPNEFGDELNRYLEEFDKASYVVDYATKFVDPSLYDAYFAAVIYPVCASAAHTRSLLKAQEARTLASGRNGTIDREALEEQIRKACAESQRAYQEVRKLTEYYNDVVSDGKWKWSMDMRPRDLPVFLHLRPSHDHQPPLATQPVEIMHHREYQLCSLFSKLAHKPRFIMVPQRASINTVYIPCHIKEKFKIVTSHFRIMDICNPKLSDVIVVSLTHLMPYEARLSGSEP